jgi:hypothetical protein
MPPLEENVPSTPPRTLPRKYPRGQAETSEQAERRRQVRGLLLLAVAAIVIAILRAGVHNVFTRGWWRLW